MFNAYLLKQLRLEVRYMKRGDPLFEILEEELTVRGLWKVKGKPRGRAFPRGSEHPNVKKRQEKQ